MAKSLLAVKKKKAAPRKPKFMDEKYTGAEPTWSGASAWDDDRKRREIRHGYYFYNYYMTAGDMRKYVDQVGKAVLKWSKEDIKAWTEVEDGRVGITLGSFSKMTLDGAPLSQADCDFALNRIKELLEYGKNKLAEKTANEPKAAVKRTVQDHMNDKFADIVGEVEALYDAMLRGEDARDFVTLFRELNMPQQFVSRMMAYYEPKREELTASQDKKADEQLREGYRWVDKNIFKRIDAWYAQLFDALKTYGKVKSATRKVRKARPVSKEKLVKKVKYCVEDKSLNIVSVNPVDIIGAHTVWVYNIKTRKLGKYVADSGAQILGIKGSAIVGFHDKSSLAKTLRKPAEQLKAFGDAGKVQLRTFLEDIKAVPVQLNGRLSKDVVILKAIK